MAKLYAVLIICGYYITVFTVRTALCHHRPVSGQGRSDGVKPKDRPLEAEKSSSDSGEADNEPSTRDHRVIQSGDILTPPELLPVAKRLITQVDTTIPGKGVGVVSSARSSEELADLLFHRFFMTNDRIVELTKFDISGIDALQALALNGAGVQQNLKLVSVDGGRCFVDKMDQDGVVNNNMCYFDGPEPRKSIYRLLTKPKELKREKDNVVTSQRRKRKAVDSDKIIPQNLNSNSNKENVSHRHATTSLPKAATVQKKANLTGCRWKYSCPNIGDLDTCRLITSCPNREQKDENKEYEQVLQRARRMIGIASVDEEVEKIFENRIVTFQAIKQRARKESPARPNIPVAPMETLDQYISNLLMRQALSSKNEKPGQKLNKNGPTETGGSGELVELNSASNEKEK